MGLHIKAQDIPVRLHSPIKGEGQKEVSRVYGNECDLSPNWYKPGYHTQPHHHDSEQLNYVLEGEVLFFVENQGFHCKKGDYCRIPRGKMHWAWNNFDQTSLVIECHSPPLVGGTKLGKVAVGLFDEGETPALSGIAENLYIREFDPTEAEAPFRKK